VAEDSKYWKSLSEKEAEKGSGGVNEFAENSAQHFPLTELSEMSRKQFLALLSASAAFAIAGCSNYRDRGEIIPYTRKPEEVTPGVANYYASTCNGCAQCCGILIKTREGRPVKVDGNPDHPVNLGKICPKGQANILNLYDPYRRRAPGFGSASGDPGSLDWKKADALMIGHLTEAARNGKEIALITRGIYSPSTIKVLGDFRLKFPTAKVYAYELFNEAARARAWEKCYGRAVLPVIKWEKAKIILALESDFLGTEGMTLEQIRKFTAGRDINKPQDFKRLYSVEGNMSLTGMNADYRLRLRPDAQLDFVLAVLKEIQMTNGEAAAQSGLKNMLDKASLKAFAAKHELDPEILRQLTEDLLKNRGESIVHAGNMLPESVHIAVNHLNEVLGSSPLYSTGSSGVEYPYLTPPEEWEELTSRMKTGKVGVVIHFGSNPVYHLPAEFGYEQALKSVPYSASLTETDDETSRLCTYVLPVHHAFESWGDFKIRSGVFSLQQPVIAPLYDTRQKEAVLLAWIYGEDAYKDTIYHQYLMNRWEKEVYPSLDKTVDFKSFWYSSLHDGVVEFEEIVRLTNKFQAAQLERIGSTAESAGFTVALTESYFIGDGTYANNGWLEELPHPVSKVVWDNYAGISPKTAKGLSLENGDLLELKLPHASLTLPVLLQPGLADQFVAVCLGYGRWNAGPIGTGVGVNAGLLLAKESITASRILTEGAVNKAEGKYGLVSTQEHHSLDDAFVKDFHIKRKIIQEGTLEEYGREPDFLHKKKPELFNIAASVEYKGVKWAMAIDLNKCIACAACVAGCNVENNIPAVGKEQVGKGREMQWLRIDRYYSGTPDSPKLSWQPMLCQHCDNAPCENVCPVVATNHSPDGLNQMVYNRCVGTKYCSNNCPYKVRRFNFFNWRDYLADGYYEQEPISLLHNPEVTVRSRGVMEKCTFCVQRIMEARQHAAEQRREIKGNDVRTACQESCPASAIVFGDMNDPNSEVSKYRSHNLGYYVLEEVNTKPNVTYMARLRDVSAEAAP